MPTTPEEFLERPEQSIDELQRRWLKPLGPVMAALHFALYCANWLFIRAAFRYRVEGLDQLPSERPLIFAPNHESSLDVPLLAAALPYSIVRRTHWAGWKGRVLTNPFLRFVNRLAQTLPIDRDHSALAAGAAALRQGRNLTWFPEGTRSRDGQMREFKFGVGALARTTQVTVAPVGIEGAYEAYPPGAWFPRFFSSVAVHFGEPLSPNEIDADDDAQAYQRIADTLHDRVEKLN